MAADRHDPTAREQLVEGRRRARDAGPDAAAATAPTPALDPRASALAALQRSAGNPHGGIPVPFSPGVTAMSVEGIWQALKVFATADVDLGKLQVADTKNLKRTTRRFGPVHGHRGGVHGTRLLSYVDARRAIYLPSYRWVLDHRVADLVRRLETEAASGSVVLLDYTDNDDVDDVSSPLSHAGLIIRYIEERAADRLEDRP